jgi:hypothetical protein
VNIEEEKASESKIMEESQKRKNHYAEQAMEDDTSCFISADDRYHRDSFHRDSLCPAV